MLAAIEAVPQSPDEWARFAFDHRNSHDRIRAAIGKATGANLLDYPIDPINPDNLANFLEFNSLLHDDMNSALKLISTDLQDVDMRDQKQLATWINLHYLEHYYAEAALKI